ncbi:MAG: hypothetical protein DRP01_09370 [Archaeoglobales archaeon]|nr:MAG: hypothetical protein DRP01_09370 [Archaeoglobales archaeon]
MDDCLGSVLDLLKKTNQEQNTLFMWAPDHGSQWPHERQNVYDGALKMPFIARWPGKIKPGTKTDALCSLVDILPTFIDAAGGNVDELVTKCGGQDFDGKSVLPILLGQKSEHHKAVYGVVSYGPIEAYPMRSIRTKKFQYIWNIDSHFQYPSNWTMEGLPAFESMNKLWKSWEEKAKTDAFAAERIRAEKYRPPEELYDIQQDPYEMKNLADDPSYQDVLAAMRQKLKTWMKQQGDNGDNAYHAEINPEDPFFEKVFCRQKIVNIKVDMIWNNPGERTNVRLTSPVWIAKIHYTLDGSEPTKDSPLYTKPFTVKPRITIKAKGFWDGDETPTRELKYWGPTPTHIYEQMHLKPIFWP